MKTRKSILIIVLCGLAAAGVCTALIFSRNAAQTPSAAKTPESGRKSGMEQSQNVSEGKKVLNIYSYDDELDEVINKYIQLHPEFDYEIQYWNTPMVDAYHTLSLINENLQSDAEAVADIYTVPAAYASKFIKGALSAYACPYKELGIDVEAAVKKADIPQYVVEAGTNPDGEIIALPYKPYVNVFMYRRSIAREVWGTDDPDKIAALIGGGTESWDKFMEAAQTLKEKGYYIVPGCHDLSRMVDTGLYVFQQGSDPAPSIYPSWEEFMDRAKVFYDQGYIKDIMPFTEEWSLALNGKGDKPVFGFVIMLDFIDSPALDTYLKDTAGDWAICLPPFKTADGNLTGIMVNKNSPHRDELGPLIEWITLDCSEKGLQPLRASGALYSQSVDGYHVWDMYGGKRPVVSGTVLKNTETRLDFLGGQNINPVVYDALRTPSRAYQSYSSPESDIFGIWADETLAYIRDDKDKNTAIADFIKKADELELRYKEIFDEYGIAYLLR